MGWLHQNPSFLLLQHVAERIQEGLYACTSSECHKSGFGCEGWGHHHRHTVLLVAPDIGDAEIETVVV